MKQALGDSEASPAPSPMLGMAGGGGSPHRLYSAALKPEQERDISIFRSFCALKLVLDAVWSSVLLRDGMMPSAPGHRAQQSVEKDPRASGGLTSSSSSSSPAPPISNKTMSGSGRGSSSKRLPTKAARRLELGSQGLKSAIDEENFVNDLPEEIQGSVNMHRVLNQQYKWSVTDRLQEAKMYLAHVFPLGYRLEVLEDIFSLLLLTSSDVRPTKSTANADQDEPLTDRPSSSYNISSFIALVKSRNEFLADERIASEMLEVLQDCIRELRAAKYTLSQQSEDLQGEGSSLSSNGVQSSVSVASLNARTTRLEQYVNEARWRLQMVLSEHGTASSMSLFSKLESRWSGGAGERGANSCLSGSGEDSDSVWGTESEEEDVEEGERLCSGKGKVRRRQRGSLVSQTELRDDGSGSVGSRTDPAHPHQPASRCSSAGSHPRSSRGKHSPSPAPLPSSMFSVATPAPRPSGFVASRHSRVSPTPQKPISKQKLSSTSSSINSRPGASESKTNSSGSTHRHSYPHRQTYRLVDEEDDSGDCADVEERSPKMASAKKKRKRMRTRSQSSHFAASRKRRFQLAEQSSEPKPSRSSIVSRMLASAGSLLRVCLRHSNYMKAGEVVHTLHMEGQFGEAIIQFSEQFEAVGRELTQQSRLSTHSRMKRSSPSSASSVSSSHPHSSNLSHSGTPPPHSVSPKPSFSSSSTSQRQPQNMNLQVAIMNARSSFDPLQHLHQLLAPPAIHQMLFSGDSELELLMAEDEGLRCLAKHVPSLVMLDMVCGYKIGGSIATKILEMASDRLNRDLFNIADVSGPFALLKLMSDAAIHYPQSTSFPSQTALISPPHASPHSLLTVTTHVLTPSAISQTKVFADLYREAREKLEAEIDVSNAEILASKEGESADVFSQLTELVTAEENQDGMSTPTSPLRQQTPPSGNIFDELIRALHSVPPVQNIYPANVVSRGDKSLGGFHGRKSDHGVESGVVSYLWQFSRYISKLIELLIKCLDMKATSKKHVCCGCFICCFICYVVVLFILIIVAGLLLWQVCCFICCFICFCCDGFFCCGFYLLSCVFLICCCGFVSCCCCCCYDWC